jgi:hypothetical protein
MCPVCISLLDFVLLDMETLASHLPHLLCSLGLLPAKPSSSWIFCLRVLVLSSLPARFFLALVLFLARGLVGTGQIVLFFSPAS